MSDSAFGGASAPASGGASAPTFGQADSTPACGSSPPPFGQSLGGAFGQSGPAYGATSILAFADGPLAPAFGGQTSSASGGVGLLGTSQAASSSEGLCGASTPGSQPFWASPAPSVFGQTKPARLTQSSALPLFGGVGPTHVGQTASAISLLDLQTPQQGTNNIFGRASSSIGQQNPFGLQQPIQNTVVSVPSTLVTNPVETLPVTIQKTMGCSVGSGPSDQSEISSIPVSSSSNGNDVSSTPKADVKYLTPEKYSYKPLDPKKNEIRLLELDTTIESSLRGKIIHVPISAELDYWALSYCWGGLARERTILVDGKELRITVNLHGALWQLGNKHSHFWVDAICIDQENLAERSREVLRMGEIYSHAKKVAAWLGVANETSDRAMDFLQVLATKEPRPQYDEYMNYLPSENNLGKFAEEWVALKDLSNNAYWSRTWIIQELALCERKRTIHFGTKSQPWEHFDIVLGAVSDFFKSIVALPSDSSEPHGDNTGYGNVVVLSTILASFKYLDFKSLSFRQVLISGNGFLATDPRDKIYGVLTLNEELRELVPQPDYAKSKDVVFRDLTRAILDKGSNLDLICLKLATHVNETDVVSWVPNWDVHGLWHESPDWLSPKMWGQNVYHAAAGKDFVKLDVGDDSILRVLGYSYDNVDGLGPTKLYKTNEKYGVEMPSESKNAYGSEEETFMALKELSREIFPNASIGTRDPQDVGDSLNNEFLIPRVLQQVKFMDFNIKRTASVMVWLSQTKEFSFVGRELLEWYELAYAKEHPFSSWDVREDPQLDDMITCLGVVQADQWRWMSTKKGYLGRTHPQTKKGDKIVIVPGCNVPMVLRRCKDKENEGGNKKYKVVGAAYVQGIMRGEALQGVNDNQMKCFDLV